VIDTRTFPSSLPSVKRARQFVAQHFHEASAADAAALMVSELATNCVRHARSGFTITITADTATSLRVEVSDNGHGDGQPQVRHPGPAEPTGRGLQIVAALANDWGTSINDTRGHTVWFTLPTHAPTPSPSDAARAAQTPTTHTRTSASSERVVPGADPGASTFVHDDGSAEGHARVPAWIASRSSVLTRSQ
jgi:anti-sigma regulatory factor (Ser/Thr protein kinase)